MHYFHFYSSILLPDISITRRFSVPVTSLGLSMSTSSTCMALTSDQSMNNYQNLSSSSTTNIRKQACPRLLFPSKMNELNTTWSDHWPMTTLKLSKISFNPSNKHRSDWVKNGLVFRLHSSSKRQSAIYPVFVWQGPHLTKCVIRPTSAPVIIFKHGARIWQTDDRPYGGKTCNNRRYRDNSA